MTLTVTPTAHRGRLGGLLIALTALAASSGCISAQRAAQMEAAAAERSTLTGKPAPDFTLPNQDGKPVTLSALRGEWVVLYFYPEDGTPGCTCQAQEFTRTHAQFAKADAQVFGISPDTVASHRRFANDFGITVDLLADPEHKVLDLYGAWAQTMLGARVIRSTVLIDPQGTIAYHWPEVVPEGHAERVREKLAQLRAERRSAGS